LAQEERPRGNRKSQWGLFMSGFVIVLASELNEKSFEYEYSALGPTIHKRWVFESAVVDRFTNPKFANDKLFEEDDEILIVIEGAILNFRKLQKECKCDDYFQTIKSLYRRHQSNFCNVLRGEYSGALYDKKACKWVIFTNHTSAKPIFYYFDKEIFICASELRMVTQAMRKLKRSVKLDISGAYCLLTFGYMLEDYTIIENVKKLPPGCAIEIQNYRMEITAYHRFRRETNNKSSEIEIIENLDELFMNAVKLEYEKDREYGYRHIATLSGGLDSRMSVMCAKELGYDDVLNINFCQNQYYDELIARKIAYDLGEGFLSYALDGGNYLKTTVEDAVLANGGLVVYSGSAHLLTVMKTINISEYGLLHTGMIGDLILGSYLSQPTVRKARAFTGAISTKLGDRIYEIAIEATEKRYDEEMFALHNRAFNFALNGLWTSHQFTETGSPFMDVEFCDYCYSIPETMRYKVKIYINWILAKHRNCAEYLWESKKAKLTDNKILAMTKRYLWIAKVIILGKSNLRSMIPFDYWYKNNHSLREYVNTYYKEQRDLLDDYGDLRRDCESLFMDGNMMEKTQVMSLLQAMKLHCIA
jgi:asparagine synthase (glutamine-hydrolysing)